MDPPHIVGDCQWMCLLVIISAFIVYDKYLQSWPMELMSGRALGAHTYLPLHIKHTYTPYTGLFCGPRVWKNLTVQNILCALFCSLSVCHTALTITQGKLAFIMLIFFSLLQNQAMIHKKFST